MFIVIITMIEFTLYSTMGQKMATRSEALIIPGSKHHQSVSRVMEPSIVMGVAQNGWFESENPSTDDDWR